MVFIFNFVKKNTVSRKTQPSSLAGSNAKFLTNILRTRRHGVYRLKDIANMETPLPFIMDNAKRYADKGSSEVWCATGVVFADGKPRMKPLIIFRGNGLRETNKEKDAWDRRVHILFQENAWRDEPRMLD